MAPDVTLMNQTSTPTTTSLASTQSSNTPTTTTQQTLATCTTGTHASTASTLPGRVHPTSHATATATSTHVHVHTTGATRPRLALSSAQPQTPVQSSVPPNTTDDAIQRLADTLASALQHQPHRSQPIASPHPPTSTTPSEATQVSSPFHNFRPTRGSSSQQTAQSTHGLPAQKSTTMDNNNNNNNSNVSYSYASSLSLVQPPDLEVTVQRSIFDTND